MRFVVHQHRQLLNSRGELVAGGGESVSADHEAVKRLEDVDSVGRFVDDAPVAPVVEPAPAPARETKTHRWGSWKHTKDNADG